MASVEMEPTKQTNTSRGKQKQIRPNHIQLRKRKRTISSSETDPLCLSTGDTNVELTSGILEPTVEPINPRDPLNLNSAQNNKKKRVSKSTSNSVSETGTNTDNKGSHTSDLSIVVCLFVCLLFRYRNDRNSNSQAASCCY